MRNVFWLQTEQCLTEEIELNVEFEGVNFSLWSCWYLLSSTIWFCISSHTVLIIGEEALVARDLLSQIGLLRLNNHSLVLWWRCLWGRVKLTKFLVELFLWFEHNLNVHDFNLFSHWQVQLEDLSQQECKELLALTSYYKVIDFSSSTCKLHQQIFVRCDQPFYLFIGYISRDKTVGDSLHDEGRVLPPLSYL